jgi:FlaA1/EpsC-like NDP-sugar epimerase
MDLAERMIKLSGFRPYRDIDITITGLRPGEKLYEELLNDASTTLPTHHEKIMVARDVDHDVQYIRDQIIDIAAAAQKQSVNMTVAKIKALVPEFVSQNSVYEILDSQVKITK